MGNNICAYCGKGYSEEEDWPHVEGDSSRGVLKIEHFCSEEHRTNFLNASISWFVRLYHSDNILFWVNNLIEHVADNYRSNNWKPDRLLAIFAKSLLHEDCDFNWVGLKKQRVTNKENVSAFFNFNLIRILMINQF